MHDRRRIRGAAWQLRDRGNAAARNLAVAAGSGGLLAWIARELHLFHL